ncbi:MAG: hypothetical protein ABIR50_03325 [Ginsengibacter sp.]
MIFRFTVNELFCFFLFVADIDFKNEISEEIKFTFFWKEANRWEEKEDGVKIEN